jgi:hypothetical protein
MEGDELPEADTSLFQSGFTFGTSSLSPQQPQQCNPFEGYNIEQQTDLQLVQSLFQGQQNQQNPHHLSLDPLDTHSYSPLDTSPLSTSSVHSYSPSYSGSPAPSENGEKELQLHAPQPVHPTSIEDVDVDLAFFENDAQQQQPMQDIQTSETSVEPSAASIDSAMAFNELWKGLSSSGSFAVAMGFQLDSTTQHTTDEYTFQSSPVLETAEGNANIEQDEFTQMLRDQHEQLALESC